MGINKRVSNGMHEIIEDAPGLFRITKFGRGMFETRMRCVVFSWAHAQRIFQMFDLDKADQYQDSYRFILPYSEKNILKIKLALI